MIDISEFKKDLKKFWEKADSLLKEDKYNQAIQCYIQSITCLNNLLKYDENQYNTPVYLVKKKEIEQKIEEIRAREKKEIQQNIEQLNIEQLTNKAKELMTDALYYDKLGDYEKAYDLYIKTVIHIQHLIKKDINPYTKKLYIEKAKSFCIRAKEIKEKELKYIENKSEIDNDKYNELNNNSNNNNLELLNIIKEKDQKIKDLESKLARYPIKLEEGEKLISVIFQSVNQEIHCSIICKNNDQFYKLEEQLYNEYPNYRNVENYFVVNGNKINRFKNLIENKIKNNDIITLITID